MVTGPCSILRTNGPNSPMPTKPVRVVGATCASRSRSPPATRRSRTSSDAPARALPWRRIRPSIMAHRARSPHGHGSLTARVPPLRSRRRRRARGATDPGGGRTRDRRARAVGACRSARPPRSARRASTSARSARRIASSTSWVTSSVAGWCRGTEVADELLHAQPGERVERGERLVEQEQLRIAHQRARQRDPLRLTARQRGRPRVRLARRARPRAARPTARARPSVRGRRARRDVPDHALGVHQPRLLEHDRAPFRHPHVARVGGVDAGQDPEQRRLAAAARTEQRHELAGRDVEVDAVEHRATVERASQTRARGRSGDVSMPRARSSGAHARAPRHRRTVRSPARSRRRGAPARRR